MANAARKVDSPSLGNSSEAVVPLLGAQSSSPRATKKNEEGGVVVKEAAGTLARNSPQGEGHPLGKSDSNTSIDDFLVDLPSSASAPLLPLPRDQSQNNVVTKVPSSLPPPKQFTPLEEEGGDGGYSALPPEASPIKVKVNDVRGTEETEYIWKVADPDIVALALLKESGLPDYLYKDIKLPPDINNRTAIDEIKITIKKSSSAPDPLDAEIANSVKEVSGWYGRLDSEWVSSPGAPNVPKLNPCAQAVKDHLESAYNRYLYPFWDITSGYLAAFYGAVFGIMVYSIMRDIPAPTWAIYLAMAVFFIYLVTPAGYVNAIQANKSIRDLIPNTHKQLSKYLYKNDWSERSKIVLSAFMIPFLIYAAAMPGANPIYETVREGFLRMCKGFEIADWCKDFTIDLTHPGSVDKEWMEGVEQILRACFLNYSIMTISKTIDELHKLHKKYPTTCTLSTLISIAMGGYYGYSSKPKIDAGFENSYMMGRMYPEDCYVREIAGYIGTVTVSVVAAKLVLAGILKIIEIGVSRKLWANIVPALIISLVAAGSGIATGVVNASSGLSMSFNGIYAILANLPFILDEAKTDIIVKITEANERIIKMEELLKASIGANPDNKKVFQQLTRVRSKAEDEVKALKQKNAIIHMVESGKSMLGKGKWHARIPGADEHHSTKELKKTASRSTMSPLPSPPPTIGRGARNGILSLPTIMEVGPTMHIHELLSEISGYLDKLDTVKYSGVIASINQILKKNSAIDANDLTAIYEKLPFDRVCIKGDDKFIPLYFVQKLEQFGFVYSNGAIKKKIEVKRVSDEDYAKDSGGPGTALSRMLQPHHMREPSHAATAFSPRVARTGAGTGAVSEVELKPFV